MRTTLVPIVAAVLVSSSGCATLFSSSTQPLTFTSTPQGAEVFLDGALLGRTPLTQQVDKRSGSAVATIRADGYQPQTFILNKTLDPVAIVNLTFILSWATDFTTGNMFEYSPGSYYVELPPVRGQRSPTADRQPFVLASHRALVNELLRGDGESMLALATLYGVPPGPSSAAFAARLRSAMPQLLAAPTPHEFFGVLDPIAVNAAATVVGS